MTDRLESILLEIQSATAADVVLVGEVLSSPAMRIKTLACRVDDRWLNSFSYLLDAHPCGAIIASGTFQCWNDVGDQFPEAFLLQDFGVQAYAGFPLCIDQDTPNAILVTLSRHPWRAPETLIDTLSSFAREFERHQDTAWNAIGRARLQAKIRIREESFHEFVVDNPTGYAFTELMPPVPIDLPEELLLHRLMTTAIVAECNPAMARMYGFAEPEDMIGINTVDAYGPEKARRNSAYWVSQHYDIRNVESQSVDSAGNVTWVSGSVFGKIVDGKLLHFWTKRRDLTEQKRYETAIQHKAHHDALTGLPNRHWFQERIAALTSDHLARGKHLCIGLLDLNGFKEINDTLGHGVGDLILQAVAVRLLKGLKQHGSEIARLGGDEFAIILPEILSPDHAEAMANTLQSLLGQPFVIEEMPLMVSGSLGLVMFPDWQGSGDDLLRLADVAMYSAKNAGQPFRWYQREIDKHSKRRLSLLTSLPQAIENEELFLVYQPKIELPSRKLSGWEALVRWQHPVHGLIPPNDFIPFAETNEVIRPLTHWVLHAAIRQGAEWLAAGQRATMAVNVSVRNLLDEQLEGVIASCLQRYGFPAELLELEVTESALMTHPAQAMELLHSLRALGISIAIDDFGTGYSSLAYLARLPVTTLKVDQSFVRDMVRSQSEAQIVRAIIGLAHQCQLDVVAEGVEDAATLTALHGMGCDHAQGFHIARPMPPADIADWITAGLPRL